MDDIQKSKQKICKVCGGNALGNNFDVITCESCKTFFRRNATRNTDSFKCRFDNCCKINVTTRRICRKCRFAKCLAVGMNSSCLFAGKIKPSKINGNNTDNHFDVDWNLTESTSYSVNPSSDSRKLMHNANPKPRAIVNAMPQQPLSVTATEPCHLTASSTYSESDENTLILAEDNELCTDTNWFDCCFIKNLPSDISWIAEEDLVQFFSENNEISVCNNVEIKSWEEKRDDRDDNGPNNIICKTWPHKNSKEVLESVLNAESSYPANGKELQIFGSKMLTTIEGQKIDELICANPFSSCLSRITSDYQMLCESIHDIDLIESKETDNFVRLIIKLTKKITAFKHSCVEDQIELLKGSCLGIMYLWGAILYDSEIDGWKCSDNFIFIKVHQHLKRMQEFKIKDCEKYTQFVQSFDSTWRNDEIINLILTMIILFTPTRPTILHLEVVEKELYSYYFLLQRYLEFKHPRCDAQDHFMRLLQTLQDVKILSKIGREYFTKTKPKHYGPLVNEILSLQI